MSLIIATEEGVTELHSVYIAGPMRGIPEYNFPAFFAMEAFLESYGITIYNPARKDREAGFVPEGMNGTNEELDTAGFDLQAALSWDTQRIIYDADALILLPGWFESNGARAEYFLARALGKPAFECESGMFYEIQETETVYE